MPRNVEIKAVVGDWDRACQIAARLSDVPLEVIEQEDTFFVCATGRLKLRRLGSQRGELIAYQRENKAGAKVSHYSITKTNEPEILCKVLSDALGIQGIVRKRRFFYKRGSTRIHLDQVEGLGSFLELEVVMKEDQPLSDGEEIARELMVQLEIPPDALISGAYLDLLAAPKIL